MSGSGDPPHSLDDTVRDFGDLEGELSFPTGESSRTLLEAESDTRITEGISQVSTLAAVVTAPAEAAPPPSGPPARSVPRRYPKIPGYDILRVLGRGGMGVVYVAQQVKLCRLVALKSVLSDAHAGEEQLARFLNEAESIARIQHPNIVQVMDCGEHDGVPFFVMEYIRGGSLADRLKGKLYAPAESAQFIEVLAHAIAAIHARGTIHRDIKPANILLAGDPERPLLQSVPKISDFGLAKRLDLPADRTQTGLVLGSPNYIAPEQAQGRSEDVGFPTDLYALGTILYEMLVGSPPFRSDNPMQTLQRVVYDVPTPPRRIRPDIPADLETICLRCLRKKPCERYPSAAELIEDLRRFREGLPILSRPVGMWERVRIVARKHPVVLAVAGLAIAGWLTALLLFLDRLARPPAQPAPPPALGRRLEVASPHRPGYLGWARASTQVLERSAPRHAGRALGRRDPWAGNCSPGC